MAYETPAHCESGNGLTEDGSGLCLRKDTTTVEVSESKAGVRRTKMFRMCRGCARHWVNLHPRTVRILDVAEASA